mmetsp:Transcript_34654/g.69322  ORF Transcript_34654/g.69322 Transcript_34654/m.69322 type:complete len:187 (+) Transcript_34654:86-646(+)
MSVHTRWIASSVLGSTAVVACLGLDRFLPGGSYPPGLLSQLSDSSEQIELLEKQISSLKAAVKTLTQSQVAIEQVNFGLRAFVHIALFGSFFLFKRYVFNGKTLSEAQEETVEDAEEFSAELMQSGLGDTSNLLQQELDGMKEQQAETAQKIAILEKRAHSLRQDVREELRKVRQLAGISLARNPP